MTDWKSPSYVVVDVEGNGHQPPDLVELAAVPIVDGIIGEPVSWLVRPDQPITSFARRIHGITNEQVEDAPVFAYVEADVLKALDASALIAHNAHVDVGVLQRKLGDWECPEVFDTLSLPSSGAWSGQLQARFAGRRVRPGRGFGRRAQAAPRHLRRAGDSPAVRATRRPAEAGRTSRSTVRERRC